MNKTEAIRALDYRVTQLEALAAKSQVTINPDKITLVDMDTGERVTMTPRSKPADVALTPPRPWCVGDVVRLARYETETDGLSWLENEAHLVGTEQKITNIHKDGDIWLSAGTNWPASALTLIRPAAQWVPNVGERVVLLDEANDNPVRRSWVGTFGHINLPEREDGMCRLDLENGEKNIYWAKNHLHPAAPVDGLAELRAENARLGAEIKAAQDQKNDDRFMLLGEWNKAAAERDTALENLRCTKLALNTTSAQRDQFLNERDALTAECERLRVELNDRNSRISTAELALQQAVEDRDSALLDCGILRQRLATAERDEKDALNRLYPMIAERDALRARIDGGKTIYRVGNGAWHELPLDNYTHTARLIDIAPIAADERKVEAQRCTCRDTSTCRNSNGNCYYAGNDELLDNRRRTPGTIADREDRKGKADRREECIHPRSGSNPRYGKKPIRSIDTARWVATIEHARSNDRRTVNPTGTRADRKEAPHDAA